MSWTSTTTHHLECDICHAGSTFTDQYRDAFPGRVPDLPADWRQVGGTDICDNCIGRMTLPEYLAIRDEYARQQREEQAYYRAQEKERRAALKAERTTA